MLSTIDSNELAGGDLISKATRSLLNPNQTIPAGAGATALQAFVNQGGTYVGTLGNGTTTARNAGITTLNTVASTSLNGPGATFATPGSTFTGSFFPASPVAWGFDDSGFIFRDATGNPIYDEATMGDAPRRGALRQPPQEPRLLAFGDGAGQARRAPGVVEDPFGAAGRS